MKKLFLIALISLGMFGNAQAADALSSAADDCDRPKQASDTAGVCAKPAGTGGNGYGFMPSDPGAIEITSCYSDKDCPSELFCSKKGKSAEGICVRKR